MGKHNPNPFSHAFRGIWETFRSERNFRIQLGVALVVAAFGFWYGLQLSEWFWVLLSITLVLVMELLNTAIEAGIDLVSPAFHPLAKKAKDAAAAAVFIAAVFAFIVGLVIFLPKFWPGLVN